MIQVRCTVRTMHGSVFDLGRSIEVGSITIARPHIAVEMHAGPR